MKLKQKLSLLTVGSVILTSLVAALFAHFLGKRMIERTWRTRFQDFTQALVLPLSRAIVERDQVLLEAYAYDIKSRPSLYIYSLRVLSAAGALLVSLSEEEESLDAPKRTSLGLSPKLLSYSTPLIWSGQAVGEVQIEFVDTPVAMALTGMQRLVFVIALLGSLLAILVSVRIGNRLLQPVTTLMDQIGKLRRNEPAVLTPAASADEIGEMSNAFLDVYQELRQRERHNREMVSKLQEMTQKLSDELAMNAKLRERLEEENRILHQQVETSRSPVTVIGADGDLAPVVQQAYKAAQSRLSVLLSGESGTGKEILAHLIHQSSDRHSKSFVTVNCAALPENLIESELFGHEKGAFTGASEKTLGKFELADSGTIFLDEIGELLLHMQPKLLRVLESGQVDRIGARETVRVDVRVIAATNRDLAQEVASGRFREDLYYRLKVIHIHVPPLRERRRDIEGFAKVFIEQTAEEMGIPPALLSPAALRALQSYPWPGNVRELRHVLAATISQHPVVVLEPEHFGPLLSVAGKMARRGDSELHGSVAGLELSEAVDGGFDDSMDKQERLLLERLLSHCDSQKEIAQRLNISEARLHRLLSKHRLLGWKQQKREASDI